ncbi:MAG: IclR family transcriptional regulator [Burkholderiales bacterium]|nr:IclR family transcriptional regulator [Burkholderiales bacterium]
MKRAGKTTKATKDAPPIGADERLFLSSVAKAFKVLEVLSESRSALTLTELVPRVELDKSAVQRLTHTLRVLGYVRHHPGTRAYCLSSRMLEFGYAMQAHDIVRAAAHPVLERLNRETGETINLSFLEGTEVVYVARYSSVHAVNIDLHIGSRIPAYCAASGRAILSRMDEAEVRRILENSRRVPRTLSTIVDLQQLMKAVAEARKRGYASNNEEAHVGDIGIAAPLCDGAGRVVGAVNVAAPTPRWTLPELEKQLAPKLLRAAAQISRNLGVL